MSARAFLSIGEVLQLLQEEFPDVTISKIRFLESQGLIDPERTPSGYRKFYDLDIERLRFILREQKDSYLPLRVIRKRLEAGEGTGPVVRPVAPAANGGASEPEPDPPPLPPVDLEPPVIEAQPPPDEEELAIIPSSSLTFEELVGASGLSATQLREVERYGLVVGRPVGRTTYYDEEALVVAR
ncbi:MAG TPA: MerR family transcriptional regulator, partial [Acidimicrobiales bacterium]|nr:MerR family transcriptional regulator [Acidimicrobiales bacterium]